MGWPRGVSRKDYMAKKKAVMPPDGPAQEPELHNAQPASQPEVRAPRQRLADVLAAQKASVDKRPKWKLKAGNLWDTHDSDDNDVPDVLKIPRDVYPEGVEFMWGTRSIRGQDMREIRNGYRKSDWYEVHDEDLEQWPAFHEYAKNRWARDESGFIVYEACILLIQRAELTAAAVKRAERRAKEQLQIREQSIIGGGIAATGANHPSAIGQNRIVRSVERLEIPKE